MDEYIEKLISQIRCKKARESIADEIRNHLEEQYECNKENGMTDTEAEKNAVLDMGDPVEVGISLDRVHKPRVAWNVIAIVSILSVLAIIIQWSISNAFTIAENIGLNSNVRYIGSLSSFVVSIIAGIIVMAVIFFIDYTLIAKYSKIIGIVMIGMGIIFLHTGNTLNGVHYYITGFGFSFASFMMMYVPIYGAILYKYRGKGKSALIKCILWMIIPVWLTLRTPNMKVAAIIMMCLLVQLSIAVSKGWFNLHIKRTLAVLWTAFLIAPVCGLGIMFFGHKLASYQEARIRAFFRNDNDVNYITNTIRAFLKNSALVGSGKESIFGNIPDINQDYVFTYIVNSYGIIAGTLIVALLATLILFMFSAVIKQKNELGLVMGTGCGMVVLLNTIINILSCIGFIPPVSSFLPFFSSGDSNMILSYVLVGFIISIYRYKDVYLKNVDGKVSLKKRLDINL